MGIENRCVLEFCVADTLAQAVCDMMRLLVVQKGRATHRACVSYQDLRSQQRM